MKSHNLVTHDNICELSSRYITGRLDGITLFRFTHIYRNQYAGGVEQYLNHLNKRLLERNKMNIIQMYETTEHRTHIDIEYIGQGKLVWVPYIIKNNEQRNRLWGWMKIWNTLKQKSYNRIHSISVLFLIAEYMFGNKLRAYHRNFVDNDIALNIFEHYNVNIIAFHWIDHDSDVFIAKALERRIPFIVINHFDNCKYSTFFVKRQILKASGIAGISVVNVPVHLKEVFLNLSDGIDTDYFNLDKAKLLYKTPKVNLVFLPSRITPLKGHLDAIRAIALLNQEDIEIKLVFAGLCDNNSYMNKLKKHIANLNLTSKVIFAGQLNMQALRDYYASSDAVILPSYSEGLGRVLLEAQSMQKPVVAYNTGGIPEAIQDGVTGHLARTGDYRDLAEKLKTILLNEELKMNMGLNARNFIISKFNYDDLIIRHENFYINAMMLAR